MPPVGFELTIPAGERPQACALDRAATGIGHLYECTNVNIKATMLCPLFFLPNEKAIARILLTHFINTQLLLQKFHGRILLRKLIFRKELKLI